MQRKSFGGRADVLRAKERVRRDSDENEGRRRLLDHTLANVEGIHRVGQCCVTGRIHSRFKALGLML